MERAARHRNTRRTVESTAMFELISKGHKRSPHSDVGPMVVSWSLHLLAAAGLVVPLLFATGQLPVVPHMMAFVAAAAPAPPPPPPPPAPVAARATAAKPVPTSGPHAAPAEAPREILPEMPVDTAFDTGVPGGVEGGVPGGVVGGVVGGMLDAPPPPPPPPPPPSPAPSAPIRVGGEIQTPQLLLRVNPVYPDIAVSAQMQGVVILEALVGRDGRVENVKVLRSIPLLDKAAREAVLQWQYSPLLLNGRPERFLVSVTVSFNLKRKEG